MRGVSSFEEHLRDGAVRGSTRSSRDEFAISNISSSGIQGPPALKRRERVVSESLTVRQWLYSTVGHVRPQPHARDRIRGPWVEGLGRLVLFSCHRAHSGLARHREHGCDSAV